MLFPKMRLRRGSFVLAPIPQITLAIVICIILPFLIQSNGMPRGLDNPEAQNTALASMVGLIAGFWLHRSLSSLPGTWESSGILPSYLLSFGGVLMAILLFRIDYSRALLVACFVLAIGWFYAVYAITQRRSTLRLGVVAGGSTSLFDDMSEVISKVPLTLSEMPTNLDAVTADFRHDHDDAWEKRLSEYVLAGIPVYHAKDLWESLTGRADLEHLSENNIGSLAPLATFQEAKRVIDRLLAVPALVVAAPVMLIAVVAIKLDSPGSALFRQKRMGFRGKEFEVLKFRTMRSRLPTEAGLKREDFITREGDARITRLGRLLRRSRIDELPQIFNVLRGEMSWIGPRPEASALSEWYENEIPFYRYRHVVVPGITGWAQVSQGHVAEIDDVRTKLQYDFYYIRNFSLWLDLLIIAKTIRTVLTGFGHK